jgi:hypothetical protein
VASVLVFVFPSAIAPQHVSKVQIRAITHGIRDPSAFRRQKRTQWKRPLTKFSFLLFLPFCCSFVFFSASFSHASVEVEPGIVQTGKELVSVKIGRRADVCVCVCVLPFVFSIALCSSAGKFKRRKRQALLNSVRRKRWDCEWLRRTIY